jgi:hypothetical protein
MKHIKLLLLLLFTAACWTRVDAQCAMQVSMTYTHNSANVYTLLGSQTGGTGAITYYWNIDGVNVSGGTNNTHQTQLSAGLHNVCVVAFDANQCFDSTCYQINAPQSGCQLAVTLNDSIYPTLAYFNAIATGGTAPLTYTWSAPNHSGNQAYATQSGTYCVTVTDTLGCSATACQTVTIGNQCNISVTVTHDSGMYYNYMQAHVIDSNNSQFTYHWSSGATSDTVRVWYGQPGYCVTVTDGNGCSASACGSASCSLTANITAQSSTGYTLLYANGSGGSGQYTYQWTGGASNSAALTVVNNGLYCVTITDAGGCSAQACYAVTLPCNFTLQIADSNFNNSYHGLTAIPSVPNSAGYTYHWSIGSTASGIYVQTSGTYCVTATKTGTNCTASACISVSLCNVAANITAQNQGTAAILSVTATGNRPPFTYHWSNNLGNSNIVTVVNSGTYCVTVTDSTGCSTVSCKTITLGCHIHASLLDSNLGNYHYLYTMIDSGTAPYIYHWSNNWTTGSQTVSTSGNYCVTVTDANGCSASTCDSVYFPPITDTICGTIFSDANGNGVQDANEHGLAGQHILLYNQNGYYATVYADSSGHYSYPVPSSSYQIYYTNTSGVAFSIPLNTNNQGSAGYSGVVIQGGGYHCGYDFGVYSNTATISGYVYLDANNNGVKDAGETGISYAHVYVGPHSVYTNSAGYFVYVGTVGTYTVSYVPSAQYSAYTVNPNTNYSVTASTAGNVYTGNDFGLHLSTSACNIATQIIPHTTVTAGHPAWYYVYVSNYGSNVASGTMTFNYDPALTFISSSPVQASVNTVNHFVTFNYANLQPGQYTYFYLNFEASTAVTIGQPTFEMATATENCNETNLLDNTDTIHQNATASWDPNDKIATPAGEGPQGFIAGTQELRYTINFQNTGTAPAVNVVLRDVLPSTLNLSTLRMIGASHPGYAVQVDGNTLIARFSQINLPDSGTDERGSHGYLCFAIKPNAGLTPGTQIQNGAGIYFDYNSAVLTNTTLNIIQYPLSIEELNAHATITVVPNPFSEQTTITITDHDMTGATLEVYNAIGQSVSVSAPAADGAFHFSRAGISQGVYIYHIKQADKLIGTGKLVIE